MSYERRGETANVTIESSGPDILVLCGDIRGFRIWTRKVGHASRAFRILMEPCIRAWLALKEKGYFVKLNGDGFIALKIMTKGHNCGLALSVFEDANVVAERTMAVIKNHHWPRPDGFRVRGGRGEAAVVKTSLGIDYLGDIINRVSKDYMQICPHIPFMADEGLKELLKPEKSKHITFSKGADGLFEVRMTKAS